MGVKLYKEPELKNPIMFCGWPGIGSIGIYAMESLREALNAEEFGEIEPWDFFNPRKVLIERGLLKDLEFPSSKFYFCRKASLSGQRIRKWDLIFFIGQEQPAEVRVRYAEGKKAYQMANLVLDVAENFGCRRVYTSGAAVVTQMHHTAKPRVWAVPNKQGLMEEIKKYQNTIVMSEIEGGPQGRSGQGTITGLNGLLLGVAKKRGIEAVCLMGEIPYYLQGAPWPYPKGSKSVLEVLAKMLELRLDLTQLDELARTVEENIEEFLESLYKTQALPAQVRDEIEKLRYARPTEPGPITEEEQKEMMKHLDELFREGGRQDEKLP